MNKVFRIVWNAGKGCWMAACEFARGGAPGTLAARSALFMSLLGSCPWGLAQQPSAIPANGNTLSHVAPNGTTIVDIAKPNVAGVSNNVYSTYNVNAQGLVLNNGTLDQLSRNSQLAGGVSANANLDRAASLIINQVNSTNRSVLNGFTEVLGSRADVVVANPNGISCTGCGFINTDRVTLTTGLPVFGADGSLTGFNVTRGNIDISGNGLNATAQQILDLVTRSVSLGGQINVPNLGMFLGPNAWSYGNRQITGALAGEGAVPAYALDSSLLGGMYANRIFLVATEAGVGVRMKGEASAGNGDFSLSAAGNVRMTAKVSATQQISVATIGVQSDIVLADASLSSGTGLSLNTERRLQLSGGTLVSGGDLNVQAAELQDVASGAATQDNNHRFAQGDMNLQVGGAGSIDGTQWGAGQALGSQWGTLAVGSQGARLYSTSGALLVTARSGALDLGTALVQSQKDITLSAAGGLSTAVGGTQQGIQSDSGDIHISAQGAVNLAGDATAANGSLVVQANGQLNTGGTLYARNGITLSDTAGQASLQLRNTGSLQTDGQIDIRASSVNNSGSIQAAHSSALQFNNLTNSGTWLLSTANGGATDTLTITGLINNTGTLQSAQSLGLTAAGIDNGGQMLAAGDLDLTVSSDIRNLSGGKLQAGGTLNANLPGVLSNAAGALVNANRLNLSATDIDNSGVIQGGSAADGSISVRNLFFNRSGATLNMATAGGAGQLMAWSLTNQGTLQSLGGLTLRIHDGDLTSSNSIVAADTLDIAAQSFGSPLKVQLNNGASLQGSTLNLTAAEVWLDSGSSLQSTGNMNLTTSVLRFVDSSSYIMAAKGGTGKGTILTSTMPVAGGIYSNNDLDITAAGITVTETGGIAALGNLDLHSSGYITNSGSIYAGKDLTADASVAIVNVGDARKTSLGTFYAGHDISLRAARLVNQSSIQAGRNLSVTATNIENITPGGDTRAWGDPENLQTTEIETVSKGYHCAPGVVCTDQSQWTTYQYTWSVYQRYADGGSDILSKPQLIAGDTLSLTGFGTVNNMAGVISGKTVNLTGVGGASFVNDDLALQRKDYKRTFQDYILWMGGGPGKYIDNANYNDSGDVLVSTTTVFSPGAGIFANTLNASGFSLTNKGSPFAAAGTAPATNTSTNSLAPSQAGVSPLDSISFGGIVVSLPTNPNGLFVVALDPAAQYLVVSNPRLGSLYPGFSGSSYLLLQLGINPETTQRRLGDAGYEAYLIQQQLIAQTGSNLLKGYTDQQALLQSLMENAVTQARMLGITVGQALSAEQQGRLQQDVVWLVSTKVQGQDVLVPQVYLAPATVAGINKGAIVAANTATLNLDSLNNTGGTISGATTLNLSTTGDIVNRSGSIQGGSVSLQAGGSIRNETVAMVNEGHQLASTSVGKTGAIAATENLSLDAQQDISVSGAKLTAGGDASLNAGGNISLGTVQTTKAGRLLSNKDGTRTVTDTREEGQIGSELSAGGNVSIHSGRDITVAGSTVNAQGNAALDAGGQMSITAVRERITTNTDSVSRNGLAWATEKTDVDQATGKAAAIYTGGNLTLSSGKDTEIKGSNVNVGGDLNVERVGGNLSVTTFEEKTSVTSTTESYSAFGTEAKADAGNNIAASKVEASAKLFEKSKETLEVDSTTNKGSTLLVGGNLNAGAGAVKDDVIIKGSDVAVGGNLNLQAGGDIRIEAAQDANTVKQNRQSESLSLGADATLDGPSAKIGYSRDESYGTASQSTARVSTLQAGQDVNLNATKNLTEQGAQIQAGGNVSIEAEKVQSLAAKNSYTQTGDELSVSASLGVKGETGLGGVASSFVDDNNNARFDMASATENLSALAVPNGGNVRLDLTVTTKRTISSGSGNDASASSITSGGNTGIRARSGDVTLEGTDITAGSNIAVSADKGNVNIRTADSDSRSSSQTTDVNVSVGIYADGTVSGSGSGGNSSQSSASTSQKAANFKAGGDVALTAAKDVELVGTAIDAQGAVGIAATDGKIDFKATRSATEDSANSMTANASFSVNVASREGSLGGGGSTENSSSSSSTGTVGSINAGNIDLRSKGDITLEGTKIDAKDKVRVETQGKLDYQALADTSASRKTGAQAQVNVEAGKGGGSLKVAAGTTDEFESTTKRTGGSLNAGSLEIVTGQGVRLEGTQVDVKNDASIDAGQGKLVIESAVSEHTKRVNNASVSMSAKAETREGAGQAALKIEGSHEDTQSVSNSNATLKIGGKADLKAIQGIDVKGKDITGLESVVTAETVDTHNAEVRTEERADVNRSSSSNTFASMGILVPDRKARKKFADGYNKASTSETANSVRNRVENASTALTNARATAGTKLANTMGDVRTAFKNIGADATQKTANDKDNADAKQTSNSQLTDTIQSNRDAASGNKLRNNLQQAAHLETRERARIEAQKSKNDDRAQVVLQNEDKEALVKRDNAIADLSSTLIAAEHKQKLQEINATYESDKAANTRKFEDARTENAAKALEQQAALIDRANDDRQAAVQRFGDSIQQHQGLQVRADSEHANATIKAQTDASKAKEQAEADKARQDIAAQIQRLRDARKIDSEADQKIEQARLDQAKADLQVRDDSSLDPVARAGKLADNAQAAKRQIELAQTEGADKKADIDKTYLRALDNNTKQRDEKTQQVLKTQRDAVADADLAARRQVGDSRIAEIRAKGDAEQKRIRAETSQQRQEADSVLDKALVDADAKYAKEIIEGKPETQARTARDQAKETANKAHADDVAKAERREADLLKTAQAATDGEVTAAQQARNDLDTADQGRRDALADLYRADQALTDLLVGQRSERRDAAEKDKAAEQVLLRRQDLSDTQRATELQQLRERQADAQRDREIAHLQAQADQNAARDAKAEAADLAGIDPLLPKERQDALKQSIEDRYQARADERTDNLRDGMGQARAQADQSRAQAQREGDRDRALAKAEDGANKDYKDAETAADIQLRKTLTALDKGGDILMLRGGVADTPDARKELAPAERATLKEQARMAAGREHNQRVADREIALVLARYEQDKIALEQRREDEVQQAGKVRDKALAAQPFKRQLILRRYERAMALADKKKPLRQGALYADLKSRLADIDEQRRDADVELGHTVSVQGKDVAAKILSKSFREVAQSRGGKAVDMLASQALLTADASVRQSKERADERVITDRRAADERAASLYEQAVDRASKLKDPVARENELTRAQNDLAQRLSENEQEARDRLVDNRNAALRSIADAATKSASKVKGADQARQLAQAKLLEARATALVRRASADREAERTASAEIRRIESDLTDQIIGLDADAKLSAEDRAQQRTQRQKDAQTAIDLVLSARDQKLRENGQAQGNAISSAQRQQKAAELAAGDRQRRDAAAATLSDRKETKPDDADGLDTAHAQHQRDLDAQRNAEQAYATLAQQHADDRQKADEDALRAEGAIRLDDKLPPGKRADALYKLQIDKLNAGRQRDLDQAKALADQEAAVLRAAKTAELAGLDPGLGQTAKDQAAREIDTRYQGLDGERQAALAQRESEIRLQSDLESRAINRARERDQALAKVTVDSRKTFNHAQREARQKLTSDLKRLDAVKGLSAAERERSRADLMQAAERAGRDRLASSEEAVSNERLRQDQLDHAVQRDVELEQAKLQRDSDLRQLGNLGTAEQRQAITQRFSLEQDAIEQAHIARDAEALARDKERLATIRNRQARALADLGVNATQADRDALKATNAAARKQLLDDAQTLRDKARALMDPLLTEVERTSLLKDALIDSGKLRSVDDIRVRAHRMALKPARWSHLIGIGSLNWRSKSGTEVELENSLISADVLLLARQFKAGDQGLALRVLRDPDVQKSAMVAGAVATLREEARDSLLAEITASFNGGNELAVLSVADQRRYLEQRSEVSATDSLSPAQIAGRFNAYLDEAVASLQPNNAQKTEMLTTLGYEIQDGASVEKLYDNVLTAGTVAVRKVVAEMGLSSQRADDLSAALNP
jgi:filamentous hemagglutinin